MTRPQGARTADAMQDVAADLFFRQGYAATSLREIAAGVGIQVGSLYNHIDGKAELLRNIMLQTLDDLMRAMRAALERSTDPVSTLRSALDCHLRFHATRSRDVFIGSTELRSLSPDDLDVVVARRAEYEGLLRSCVRAVCDGGHGDRVDIRLQAYAIIAIGTHVAAWYRPGGSLSLDYVVDTYTDTILRQLGIHAPLASIAPDLAKSAGLA